MSAQDQNLPARISAEAGNLLEKLRSAGWRITDSRYDDRVFGNWFVDLVHENQSMRIVKDRSQYSVDGPSYAELKAAYLQRVFDDFEEFSCTVMSWVSSTKDADHNVVPE
jgi:hypothetical protein